jgi:hypothetical protein
MKIQDLSPSLRLSVACPSCAAAPNERCCEIRSGAFRQEEHLARLLLAAGQESSSNSPSYQQETSRNYDKH